MAVHQQQSKFGNTRDTFFMNTALHQARKAAHHDEVPIGAIVVDEYGNIIGRGYNRVESSYSQTSHAELIALQKASKKKRNWRLTGCWLYVTLEPCVMCMGLVFLSRIEGIVWAADSLLFGHRLDKHVPLSVYNDDTLTVVRGVGSADAVQLLQQFFKLKREKE
jgi:tRNA(adenine34) deaminase